LALAFAPLLMLAGCDSLTAPKAGPTASGEVMPGTVTDAMLDTDRSQAQPPLAPVANSPAEKGKKADGATASEAAPDSSAAAEANPSADVPQAAPPKPKPAASPKPAAT
jgi:hypothetical protein